MQETNQIKGKRRNFSTPFKVKVALAAVKAEQMIAKPVGRYGVHPTQITQWKKQVLHKDDGTPIDWG